MRRLSKENIPLLFLLPFYFLSRLYNLTLLPIFTDESIYIYWAKFVVETKSHWFISLTDGKPPLLIWIIGILLKIFPSNSYLFAGRFASVVFGAITIVGIYKLTTLIFKSRVPAIIACILYLFHPFSLFYDRMALFDPMLTSMLVWSVFFSVKTAKTRSLKDCILWGVFLGLGFLSKPTAIIFLFLTPLCYLIFVPKDNLRYKPARTVILLLIALVIAEALNNLQRISSVYYMMDLKNQQFQQPFSQLLAKPFELASGNLPGFFSWLLSYYTLPFLILGLISFIYLLLKNKKSALVLSLLFFIPILFLATVGREIFPRYILFITPYFLICVSYFIAQIIARKGLVRVVFLCLVSIAFLPILKFDYFILKDPPLAPLPPIDYHQYISDHPSGYGLKNIFEFLNRELEKEKVTLVTQGTFGLFPYAFNLEYWNNKNLTITPRWPLISLDPEIIEASQSGKVYILLKEHEEIPKNLPLKLILKAEKPGGRYPLLLTTIR